MQPVENFIVDSNDPAQLEALGLVVVSGEHGSGHAALDVGTVPGARELLAEGFASSDEVQWCYQEMWREWPAAHLRWVPETRPDFLDVESMPSSGARRLWFFRSPWPDVAMPDVLMVLSLEAVSWEVEADPEAAMGVVRQVLTWSRERLIDAIPPHPWEDEVDEA